MSPSLRRNPAGVKEQRSRWPSVGGSVFLLDVNVLVALLDPMHSHHERAQAWFVDTGSPSWSSCALTQNGALRILAHPRYSNPAASVALAADLLADLCQYAGHRFWAGQTSLLDADLIDRGKLLTTHQITDTYLLALAVHHGGLLASFDRRLVTNAVRGGSAALHLIA